MQKEYLTILNSASTGLEERKSRFIATVKPVCSEEEAQEFIRSVGSKFWDASHNVYSYYICKDTMVQKYSDDGEPSGTAGIPVLEAIKKLGVQNLAVVVTRYFGGVLLGASGLVRAYGKCAALGIEAGIIVRKLLCFEVTIIFEYSLHGKISTYITTTGYRVKDAKYEQDVEITVFVPHDDIAGFLGRVTEITNARALTHTGGMVYITQ